MFKILITWSSATIIAAISAAGQGSFQNLDFESANLDIVSTNSYIGPQIPTTDALPGWEAFSGTSQLSTVSYDELNVFSPVELVSSDVSPDIIGNFGVLLALSTATGYGTGSISQTGLVPANARSLLFYMRTYTGGGLSVSLGGQEVSYAVISSYPPAHYSLYGADISAFAGKTETLTFSAPESVAILDNIQFSPEAIPEPSALALLLLASGVLALLGIRRRVVI